MNNLYTHEKQDKIRWIVTFVSLVLLFVMILGVCISMMVKPNEKEETKKTVAVDELGNKMYENEVYTMPSMIMFSDSGTESAKPNEYASVWVEVKVYPENATNTKVDFKVEWGEVTSELSLFPVEDFIKVEQEQDGDRRARIVCYGAFPNDSIIITVTTRDGGFTDTCTVIYKGKANSIAVTSSTMQTETMGNITDVFVLATNTTYEFDITTLTNMGTEANKVDFEVVVSGFGEELYYGDCVTDTGSGLPGKYSNIQAKNMQEFLPTLIAETRIEGKKLYVTTGKYTIESYNAGGESDEYGLTYTTYDTYLYPDDLGMQDEDYNYYANLNAERIKNASINILVIDNVSNLGASITVSVGRISVMSVDVVDIIEV